MSRRARQRANARPWEHPDALALGPDDQDDDNDQHTGDWSDGCGEPVSAAELDDTDY